MTEERNPEVDRSTIRRNEAEAEYFTQLTQKVSVETAELERYNRDIDASSEYARIYTFYDAVGGSSVKAAMKDLGIWSRRDPGEPLKIVFNSPGGNVVDGLALYDFIQELKDAGHHVETVALGWAASMGGVLLQAGHERVMGRNAYMLIHEVSSFNIGKTSEMEDELKFTKRLQERLLDILSERSTMSKNQIRNRWKRKDWWLDADEALKYGFCDVIR